MDENSQNNPPHYRDAEDALQKLADLLNQSHPEALQSVVNLTNVLIDKGRRVVLYLGAGCSASVRVKPSAGGASVKGMGWESLLEELFAALTPSKRKKFLEVHARRAGGVLASKKNPQFKDLFKVFDKLQLASFLTQSYDGPKARDEVISNKVEPDEKAECTSELYEAILELPFGDIVTTNYDGHIARFLKKRNERLSRAGKDRPFFEITKADSIATASKQEGCPRIFYLHGRVGKSLLVLDRFDYAKLLTERDGMLDYVAFLLRDSHVIYVGFGLDDPTFNQMETRLQTLHGENRPRSFAFLPAVTEKEREVWGKRNLEIIDYGADSNPSRGHDSLPEILRCVNTIRGFVNWAEPNRRGESGRPVLPNDDRTQTYWADVLRLYLEGRIEESLRACRAALASTLFWEREPVGGKNILPFDRAVKLCDIRIRLARIHYKLRWTPGGVEQHDRAMYENMEAAGRLIEEQEERQRQSLSRRVKNRDRLLLLALKNSLRIVRARVHYLKGEFKKAWSLYKDVAGSIRPRELKTNPGDSKAQIITKLKLNEGFYYAQCQISRLEYQFIDQSASDRLKERGRQVELMSEVEREIGRICEFLESKKETCEEYPEWKHYYNSLWTIRRISMWTAGRQAARVFKDLIPTEDERKDIAYGDLTRAMEEYLDYEGAEALWPLSRRWPAMRYRYQCRAYALRWIVGQHLGKEGCDKDILKAFRAIQQGFAETKGDGLERQQVVNLLEAARLNILAMFGEKLRQGGAGAIMDASPLTVGAGLHYLDEGFRAIENIPEEAPDQWLLALGYRLASYIALVAGPGLSAQMGEVQSTKLKEFLQKDAEGMVQTVGAEYRRFAERLGDLNAFDKRVGYFTESFKAIRKELGAQPTASVASPSPG